MLVDMKRPLTTDELEVVTLVRRSFANGSFRAGRTSNGLSLNDIGSAVGLTPGAVWKLEEGLRVPRVETALRCAPVYSRLMELKQ